MLLLPCSIIPLSLKRQGKNEGQRKLEFKPKLTYFFYMVILKYGVTKPKSINNVTKLLALLKESDSSNQHLTLSQAQ